MRHSRSARRPARRWRPVRHLPLDSDAERSVARRSRHRIVRPLRRGGSHTSRHAGTRRHGAERRRQPRPPPLPTGVATTTATDDAAGRTGGVLLLRRRAWTTRDPPRCWSSTRKLVRDSSIFRITSVNGGVPKLGSWHEAANDDGQQPAPPSGAWTDGVSARCENDPSISRASEIRACSAAASSSRFLFMSYSFTVTPMRTRSPRMTTATAAPAAPPSEAAEDAGEAPGVSGCAQPGMVMMVDSPSTDARFPNTAVKWLHDALPLNAATASPVPGSRDRGKHTDSLPEFRLGGDLGRLPSRTRTGSSFQSRM